MAQQTITINYPDDAGPRVLAALKAQAVREGAYEDPTAAQAMGFFRDQVRKMLRDMVHRHERDEAMRAQLDAIEQIDVT